MLRAMGVVMLLYIFYVAFVDSSHLTDKHGHGIRDMLPWGAMMAAGKS